MTYEHLEKVDEYINETEPEETNPTETSRLKEKQKNSDILKSCFIMEVSYMNNTHRQLKSF